MLEGTPLVGVVSAVGNNDNFNVSCPAEICPTSCNNVFDMVHVSYLLRGGTRIMWTLSNLFNDPMPWTFQVQVGWSGSADADDWTNVGPPLVNACYVIDPEKRSYAKGEQITHYRVKLTTLTTIYYSEPTAQAGILSVRDWRLAQEIVRKERLRFRYSAQDGYLLKRRVAGADCPLCLDLQTREVKNPYCPQCWGTGKACGYYYPVACIWADVSPMTRRRQIDDQATRGTVQDIVMSGRMLMLPLIDELDVWVSRKTDDRYFIQTIRNAAELRGVPLIANVELRPAPFTDVVYTIPIPQQDAWLQQTC